MATRSAGGLPIKLLVLATPSAPELAVLETLPKDSYTAVAIAENLAEFQQKLSADEIGLPVGGDKEVIRALVPALPGLKWIHSSFAGVNSLLFPELIDGPVVVTNAKGVFSSSLAEWALFAMSWFAKDIVRMQAGVRRREWDGGFTVGELRGATLGVVGYGDIGQAAARLARAFGMRIIALRRRPQLSLGAADPLVDEVYPPERLADLMAAADYVLVATPLTPDTLGLVSAAAIAAMRPEGVLINLGRGPCVDEAALARALAERRIKGAALDVFAVEPLPPDSPLWALAADPECSNLLISPHCADRTREFQGDTVRRFVGEAGRYSRGEPLENVVDKRAGY